jgi:(p)ppGpp synthase/HD superfamily hydrolase
MELIEAALKEKKIPYKDLSDELKGEIKDLQVMMDKYNKVCDEYESQEEDAETEKLLDEMDHDIATVEIKIANKIKNPTPTPAPAPASAPEKKDSGIGWLIFGSVVLAITLGAVNVLKKK